MNALVGGSKILGQLCCSFRGCHATSSSKSVFFTRKVAWSSLIKLHGCSWDILKTISRTFKWGIICLSSITGSHSNPLLANCTNPVDQWIWAVVYLEEIMFYIFWSKVDSFWEHDFVHTLNSGAHSNGSEIDNLCFSFDYKLK